MQLAIYETSKSNFERPGLSMQVRISMLLADTIIWAGTTVIMYSMLQDFENLSTERKLITLQGWSDEEIKVISKLLSDNYKSLKKIKHLDKESIRLKKQLENIVNEYMRICMTTLSKALNHTGFPETDGPFFKSDVMGFYYIDFTDSESEYDALKPLSQLLQGRPMGSDQMPDIPFLPIEFLLSEWNDGKAYVYDQSLQPEGADWANGWLQECFTMPNVLLATETEILLLRSQLQSITQHFRKAVDEWSQCCETNPNRIESLHFFKEHVLPAAQQFQAAFDQHEIVQARKFVIAKQSITILAGEMPLSAILKFLNHSNAITPESWVVLEQWIQQDENKNIRRPVFVMHVKNIGDLEQQTTEETEAIESNPLSTKKFISVED